MSTIPSKQVQASATVAPPPKVAASTPAHAPALAQAQDAPPVRAVARPLVPQTVTITAPIAHEESYSGLWLEGRLTGAESAVLRGIRSALEKKGARLVTGQTVETNISAVRWMLQQAAKEAPPPASQGI